VDCYDLFTGPHGELLFILVGKSHENDFLVFVKTALNYYKKLLDHALPLAAAVHILPEPKGPLLFNGEVACSRIDIQGVEGTYYKAVIIMTHRQS
jgi:hypothetical protein